MDGMTSIVLNCELKATRPLTLDGRDYAEGEIIERTPALTDRLIQQLYQARRIVPMMPMMLPVPADLTPPIPESAHDPHCRVRRR